MLCTKVLWQQRWRQCRRGDGAAERMVGGKVGGTRGQGCMCGIFVADRS